MTAKAGGYVLRASAERTFQLLQAHADGRTPVEPVSTFKHPRTTALVVFGCLNKNAVTHVATGRKGYSAGSGLSRLNLEELETLREPVPIESLIVAAPSSVRHHVKRVLESGGLLPQKSLGFFVDELLKIVPSLAGRLARYGEARARRIAEYRDVQTRNLALQKETLNVALKIGGFSRDQLLEWNPSEEVDDNFLRGLPQVYTREDAMIISDLSTVPGFEALADLPYAVKEFVQERNPQNRLTVIMANRTELEKQTGADLIYYNRTHGCVILVQYKAMSEADDPPAFRWKPGDDLEKEIARMVALRDMLRALPADSSPRGFRFSDDPFFLKICRRVQFEPDSARLFPGMYFPLALWERLAADASTQGPKGGRLLGYHNAPRRMTNSEFVELVRGAWIGTTLPQSAALTRVIERILETGKAVTFAIKDDPPPAKDGSAVSVM